MMWKKTKRRLGLAAAFAPALWLATALIAVPAQAQDSEVLASSNLTATDRESEVLVRPAQLEVSEVALEDALRELELATGVPVAYSPSLLPAHRVVSCFCTDVTVEQAVRTLLSGTGLEGVVMADHLIIRERRAPVQEVGTATWASLLMDSRARTSRAASGTPLHFSAAVRQGTITGTVVDQQSQQPLNSVQVHIPQLGLGVLSGADGSFTLSDVPAGTHTVLAQRLGYRQGSQEVTVADGETLELNFQIARDALALDELVVTGTAGGTRQRAIGNVVGRVRASEITEVAPVASMQDLLGAREAGLSFHRQSGNIGTGSQMRIRGISSVTMGSQPLIYVDGVRVDNEGAGGPNIRDGRQVSTLDDFSPEEIESIEIIKGPAAATLYGTEASAGVIQIITKRGESGAPTFDLAVRQGATWLMSLSEKIGENYGRDEQGNIISFNIYEVEKAAGREHFQTGHLQSYTASMRGGTDQIRYYLSGDFDNNVGIVDYNWQKQTNLRANVTVLPSENFTLDVSLGYIDGETSFMQQRTAWGMWEQFQWSNPEGLDRTLRGFLRARPEEIANVEAKRDMTRFTGSATLTHTPTDWLTHRLIVGTDAVGEENSILFPRHPDGANHDFGALSLGDLQVERPNRQYNTVDYAASANYQLNPTLSMTSSFGFQYYERTEREVRGTGRIFPAPQIRTLSGAASTVAEQMFVENKSVGMYLQQEFNLNDRMFLTAAVRGDDNSAFGADFDAAIYPKISGTWVVSEEDFWFDYEHLISSLRLRSAWGKAGRQPDTFAAVTLYAPEVGPGGNPAVSTDVLGNPELGPEVSSEIELGFDAAFLNDRITSEFTYYNQKVNDALVSVPVSPVSGFPGSQSVNLGQISNWGWEATVSGDLYERPGLVWNLGFGVTSNENQVDDLGGREPTTSLREGRPYPFQAGRQALSGDIDPETRNVINLTCDGGTGFDGMERGGDPVSCATAPLVKIGNGLAIPKYEASMNTTFTIGQNLRLYAMAEWRGEHYRSLTDASCRHTCFYISRAAVERPPEYVYTIAAIDGLIGSSPYTSNFNASFAKLREVSANYTLPSEMAQRIGASRASVNVAARNLWTIWQAEDDIGGAVITDPEARNSTSITGSNSNVPPLACLMLTMRVSF